MSANGGKYDYADHLEKMFKPPKLVLDPNFPTVTKEWKYWVKILNNFFYEFGDTAPNKLRTLVGCVSFRIYEYIENCTTYESAINALEQLYIKTPNEIFTLHLSIRQQTPGKSRTP